MRGPLRGILRIAPRSSVRGAMLAVLAVVLAPLALDRQVNAQGPWRLMVQADNDAFNFWRSIIDRPDEEYTNGDRVTFESGRAPWWGKRFAPNRTPCTGLETSGERCLVTAFTVGQEMYTPEPGREPGRIEDWQDERPYAAWLYASAAGRVLGDQSLRSFEITLGVTGPPAFGELAQRTAHSLTGVYSRDPVGWETQVGFEPGIMLSAREARRIARYSRSGRPVLELIPHAAMSVGNILTAAELGFDARVGTSLSHPWWTGDWRSRAPVEVYVVGGARGRGVARDITLDGNTVGATRRVDRVPFVGEYSLGVGARYRALVASWRAITRSRQYATGPAAHAFSAISASIEIPAQVRR